MTYRTLPALVGELAQRNEGWGLLEWHPCLRGSATVSGAELLAVCRAEMDLIVSTSPGLVAPVRVAGPRIPDRERTIRNGAEGLVARLDVGPQSDPRLAIEAPGDAASLAGAFTVSGWTADLGKRAPAMTDTGIDAVRVTAVKTTGVSILLGNAGYRLPRADIAATLGTQFGATGFSLMVAAGTLTPGQYRLEVSARSTLTVAPSR